MADRIQLFEWQALGEIPYCKGWNIIMVHGLWLPMERMTVFCHNLINVLAKFMRLWHNV